MKYVAWLWIGLEIICPIWHSGQSLFGPFFFQGSKLQRVKLKAQNLKHLIILMLPNAWYLVEFVQ